MKYNCKHLGLAQCGMLSSLSVVFMFFASVLPSMDVLLTMYASFLMLIALKKNGIKHGILMYISTSILAAFIIPNKSVLLYYAFFFGWYPIFSCIVTHIPRTFQLLLKMSVFNLLLLTLLKLSSAIAGYNTLVVFEKIGAWTVPLLAIFLNIFFLSYENCLSMVQNSNDEEIKKINRILHML